MVVEILIAIGAALLVTVPFMIGIPLLRYWLWLRRFKRENRIAAEKFKAQCRADDARWEAETREWLKGWEHTIANG